MSRRLMLLPLGLLAAGAVLLAADWWMCLPEGKTATYTGREQCVRCHQTEADLWTGSDHDRAMAPATPETVLGDFKNAKFVHAVFSDVTRLTDGEVRKLLEHVDGSPWAAALRDAGAEVKEKILGNMSAEASAALTGAWEKPTSLRPADVMTARHRIAQTMRRLERAGELRLDFAPVSTFSRGKEKEQGKFYVETEGPTGEKTTYEIQHTFGVRPLQQYLIEFPDGRVQCLGIAWDTQRKEWYQLYADESIRAGDELHWTRPSQTWNHMCAECHSTNLEKKFDLNNNKYHTTFAEIDVSCETCHGPGSLHVELAEGNTIFWDRRYGFGLPRLKDEDSRVEIETCAPCHSRRRVVYPNHRNDKALPQGAGQKFLDFYVPELLDQHYYYADGQILEEDYVYGSFIQSKMYERGVRCSDCHDPHSARVKLSDPDAPWWKITNNRVCTGCHMGSHVAGEFDTPAHHHHPDSSKPGTLCVDCHMPETPYMVVDPRRDHSMRIPRPDLTISLNIPNACNGCHHDESKGETPRWAEAKLRQWYGQRKKPPHFAHAFHAGRRRAPGGDVMLEAVIKRKDISAMVRASALVLLGNYGKKARLEPAQDNLEHADGLVRVAAVRSFQGLLEEDLPRIREIADLKAQVRRIQRIDDPVQRQRQMRNLRLPPGLLDRIIRSAPYREADQKVEESYTSLVPALSDPLRAVRTEAAWVLCHFPQGMFSAQDRRAFADALEEYVAGQNAAADRAESHMNLATVYDNLKQLDKTEQEYLTAIRIDPRFPQARIALARFYNRQGKHARAEQQYRGAIGVMRKLLAVSPGSNTQGKSRHVVELKFLLAQIHYWLGQLLAGDEARREDADEQLVEAEKQFRGAIESVQKLLADLGHQSPRAADFASLAAEVHYSFGLFLAENDPRLAEAAEPLARAVELQPDEHRMRYNYGVALQQLGNRAEAEGKQDEAKTRYGRAEAQYQAAYRLAPEELDYLDALVGLYAQQKRWGQAIKYARELVRRQPDDPQRRRLLKEFQQRQREDQQ